MRKKRFFNMYLTTTFSVAMVLLLVGIECVMVLSARNMMVNLRENLAITVVICQESDSTDVVRLGRVLQALPSCKQCQFVSKQDALMEHIEHLGVDPSEFLGYNPLSDAYELRLNAAYAQQDSIAIIEQQLRELPYVEDVIYPKDVVSLLDNNLTEVSLILIGVAVILLLMAFALIINTVRLHIYSKRFIINTMRLVGATPAVIRAPFIKRNLLMGLEAGIIAIVLLALALFYVDKRLGIVLFPMTWQNISMVAVAVIAVGEMVTFLASLFATSKYVRMKIDKMYEI
ncbi:MAG: permease-like cell division protein FtsX [Paludibacteraceae bacterium]|nr:permease-like cell division protein FtsX [Paludibacteraceae bacterium]